jgi:hypothetical protein
VGNLGFVEKLGFWWEIGVGVGKIRGFGGKIRGFGGKIGLLQKSPF